MARVALVTGGTRGIGRAIVERLKEDGMLVAAGYSGNDEAAAECARVAVLAHEALGLRDLSRSDLMVDADGQVWFLEVNVAPGMTETSTVPLAVAAAGLELGPLVAELVRAAVRRGPA